MNGAAEAVTNSVPELGKPRLHHDLPGRGVHFMAERAGPQHQRRRLDGPNDG